MNIVVAIAVLFGGAYGIAALVYVTLYPFRKNVDISKVMAAVFLAIIAGIVVFGPPSLNDGPDYRVRSYHR